MKISLNWIRDFLKTELKNSEIGEILTDVGLEVEADNIYSNRTSSLDHIVVARVQVVNKHPNADKLKICDVFDGNEVLKIVCGAPNVSAGINVALAKLGAKLTLEDGSKLKIKKSKIRGVPSFGMISSQYELGIGSDRDGIWVLDGSFKAGTPIENVVGKYEDQVLEIDLTPNRIDAVSHVGVCRDIFPAIIQKDKSAKFIQPQTSFGLEKEADRPIKVVVENYEKCPRYCGVVIDGIEVKESPDWLKNRLLAVGQNPINNVVDITNYCLFENGQPLHAFDYEQTGGEVIVRTLPQDTVFETLDEKEQKLSENDLMICNSKEPMCIAGVFGGAKSGVKKTTTSIFLESAVFQPQSIRKTSKFHKLNTEASYRFERGIDPSMTFWALQRATKLIIEVCGGKIASDFFDLKEQIPQQTEVIFRYSRCNKLLGTNITASEIDAILLGHNFEMEKVDEDTLKLKVPFYKGDVFREVDVIEEVARIYGYNKIGELLNFNKVSQKTDNLADKKNEVREQFSNFMIQNGFQEAMSNSLNSQNDFLKSIINKKEIDIANSLSPQLGSMRTTLLQSALDNTVRNHAYRNHDIKLFEIGNVYFLGENDTIKEEEIFSFYGTGKIFEKNWYNPLKKVDFFYFKSVFESLLNGLNIPLNQIVYETHPKQAIQNVEVSHEGVHLASFYHITPASVKAFYDLKQDFFYWEIRTDQLKPPTEVQKYREVSKIPGTERDLSLLIDQSVTFESIKKVVEKHSQGLLQNINLFDNYSDKSEKFKTQKSYSINLFFHDEKQTLNDQKVNAIMEKIMTEVKNQFHAEIR